MPSRSFFAQKRAASAKRRQPTPSSTAPRTPTARVRPSRSARRPASKASASPACAPLLQPPTPSEPLDAELDDVQHEVVLALDVRGRRDGTSSLGAAWYVAREERLYFVADVQGGAVDAADTGKSSALFPAAQLTPPPGAVRVQAEPTHILLPSRVDESVDELLGPRRNGDDGKRASEVPLTLLIVVGSPALCAHELDVRPGAEFAYDAALRRLVESPLAAGGATLLVPDGGDGLTTRQGQLLRLSAQVDLEARASVGCAGAVLAHLARRRAALYLPGDRAAEAALQVHSAEVVALGQHMMLNADAVAALQVVQAEPHPSSHNQGPSHSGSKEDLSLYGVFRHLARTPQGKALLRTWFLRPSLSLAEISARQDAVAVLAAEDNEALVRDVAKSLRSVRNMRAAATHLRKGASHGGGGFGAGVWCALRGFAFHALGIRAACTQLACGRRPPVVDRVLAEVDAHTLATLGRLVTRIVDFPASAELRRAAVNPGVDGELDQLRRTYAGLEDLLGLASRDVAAAVPADLRIELSVAFFPQLGFLACLPRNPATGRADWEGGGADRWQLMFTAGGRAYYKEPRTRGLDARVGDVWARICDKEIEIVHALAQRVLEYEPALVAASDACAELDALVALAQGARAHGLVRPRVVAANVLDIRGGRHLLQELAAGAAVPNDTLLAGGQGHERIEPEHTDPSAALMPPPPPPRGPAVLLVTGPNYSGKSVYLKQPAATVVLAHVGSFVAAAQATVGLTDRVLTRVSSRESVARPLSAFALDLRQVGAALRQATRRSLVLLDEFGKGTQAADGAALAAGVVRHFAARPAADRPRVLVATHFHDMLEAACAGNGVAVAHMGFRVLAGGGAGDVEYLYQLKGGCSGASLGVACARRCGVDEQVVARAEELLLIEAAGGDLVAACAAGRRDQGESDEASRAEEVARRFVAAGLDGGGDARRWRAVLEGLV